MKKTKLFFLATVLLFLTACLCKEEVIETIRFTDEQSQVNPYQGNEMLIFQDGDGNSVSYLGQSRKVDIREYKSCKNCCEDYYAVEWVDNTKFESDFLNSDLQVVLSMNFDVHSLETHPEVHFSWNYYETGSTVRGTTFQAFPINGMQSYAKENGQFSDSLMLRGRTFHDVYSSPGSSIYPDKLHGDTLYYTQNEGIVGLKLSDGRLFVVE